MRNAIEYYNRQFNLGALSREEREQFINRHGLKNMSIADREQYYKNNQFTNYFNSDPNYSRLRALDYKQRNELLDNAILNKTINTFFNKDNTSEDNLIRINQLTPEGKKDLINSDYDPSDKYYATNPLITIGAGATLGAAIGSTAFGAGAIPGAIQGAGYGAIVAIGDALASSLYNDNTENKLNEVVAKDNDRKKEKAQEIVPQVSNLLRSVTSGDIFKDADTMQQATPILQELKAYGVDVSKGEASNLDTLFNKIVAKNNSYYDVFKDRTELSDFTNGDKLNMITQTLATDLMFNDGGYSSMSINNQDLQKHISNNQSAWDWGYNTGKNLIVGTVGALGETVAGLAAAGAYCYDKVDNALGGNSHLTNDILEGNDVPLLLDLPYWDGVDKFNTFDSDIIKKARENGGISPYNNVSLAEDEGKFFSWASLNEAVKMGKYLIANRATAGILGKVSGLVKNATKYAAPKLGMEATKALDLSNTVGKWGAMGTYMVSGVPVASGYGLGAYDDVKLNLTEKEDKRQANELLKSYINTEEFNDKVKARANEIVQANTAEGRDISLEDATTLANSQVTEEMNAYFTDYVKNNRDKVANDNKDFKENRDNIKRIATDAFALDATIEAAKNTFVNINYRSYLFGKQTNQLLKGEQSGIKPYNPRIIEQRYNPLTKKMELINNTERGNLFYNDQTKQMEYREAPKKAGWIAAKDAVWGGFISNYTDDLTTGAVEGAAFQRYDNYLEQKYNKNAINSVGKFLENLYSTSNAFIQGGIDKMTDKQSFYDGFVGALGSVVPGSGRLFRKSPYENAESRKERSTKDKLLERIISTTGVGNAYYDAKYRDIANKEAVSQVNKILSNRSLDLIDILDLASATNLAESAIENGTLSEAKSAKDRAFLSTLLFLNREKDNPIVQAHPAIQHALRAINAIREGTLGTEKANEETKALYENMKYEFLKELSNKEDAKLPPEEAEAAAEKRLQHTISKAKVIIDSMDKTMAKLQTEHLNITPAALDFITTTKVMADTYEGRINDMEKSLGLTEGNTVSHKQDVNDVLAMYSNKKLQESRLKEIQHERESLSKQIGQLKESLKAKKEGKNVTKASIKALEENIDNLSIEESLIKEAGTHLNENGKFSGTFTEEQIENMDATPRAYLFSTKDKLSPEQKKVLDNLEQKYLERGITNTEEYMNDLAKLKNAREGNIKAFTDSSKNPKIALELLSRKEEEFLKAVANTRDELVGDAIEEDLTKIREDIFTNNKIEQEDYPTIFKVLYGYNNRALDKVINRHADNESLNNIINKVKEVNSFKDKMFLALLETPELGRSVDNILLNSLLKNNSIDAEFEEVFSSDAVDDNTKSALKKAYNKAKGIENTEKATVTETKEEKKARQESQETQAKQEEKKVQDAEDKADIKSKETQSKDKIQTSNQGTSSQSNIKKPSYFSSMEKQLEDKKSSWEYYRDDINRTYGGIEYVVGKPYQATLEPAIKLAVDSGVLPKKYKDYLNRTRDNAIEKKDLQEIINEFKKLGIHNPKELIEYIKRNTTQEASSQSNIQETYQETEKEKSNEQNAQEAYTETEQERRNQEEANRQLHTYEQTDEDIARDKAIEEQRKEGVDFSSGTIDFESPNWEKQVEQAEAEGHKIEEGFVSKDTADVTDQGNRESMQPSEVLAGNYFHRYDVDALIEDKKEVVSYGREGDTLDRILKWFENAGIKLQEIVDTEVGDIMKTKPEVHLLYVNPKTTATDDACFSDTAMLAVEYTDKISKIHNNDRGGVITANGKQYLIIGTLGFNNREQQSNYVSVHNPAKGSRLKYFTANPNERFYILPTAHTEIAEMTSGRITRQLESDSEVKIRPITELLSEPNRNPKGLKLQDLKWGIMFEDGLHYANVSPRNTVYPPRDTLSNLGAVFLLVEAANGNYIPVAIRPTMLSDLQDGALKTQLNNLFNELSSTKHSDRLGAINQLVKLLNIKEEGDNILVGMKDKATVSTVKNGTVLRTFNLKDANFSRMDLINAIFELNPRVNITLSTLSDPVQLKMYAEAGALNTDIAKLGTSNASYTVYSMDANGNPIKTKPIENRDPSTEANSDLNKADYKKKHSVYYRGSQYREKNGKWYNTNWKEVTDPILLSQIKWTSYIRVNDLIPNLVGNDMFGNKNNKYYIINSNPTNAKVIKVLSNGIVAELNINDSRVIIEKVQNRDIQAAREKVAKEEKERLMHIENSMDYNNVEATGEGKDVTEVNEISGANLTEEQIVAQGNGDFQLDSKPQQTDTELKAQAMVDRITTDTHSITLDSKRGIYTDSTGKEYARVTSVIQATKDAERFDPNSPWAVPSTNIGTGVDNFVRDFFANKLGNVDNLNERYPNAGITQLKSFLKQLEGLKEKFDKAGLTVVPRDVTVTGEVEVTDANGKKYKLAVAGTLDLLAYDKEGNFYIFDMKTNRSVPNEKKVAKWDKQLSLYKQFLETKYGISVKGTSIIPIEVKYPIPKGWGNGKTIYRADEKTNQLYYQTEDNSGALTSSTPYRDAKPILHSNIPISTSPVKIEYNLLTDSEKALLSPVVDGTFNSSTGTTNIESKNKNKDINKTGDISLAELQASTNAKPTDVSSMLKNRNYSKKVRGILKEKGFNGKMSEVEAWLKEHNMPISNIKDIDSWIDMLQNCR